MIQADFSKSSTSHLYTLHSFSSCSQLQRMNGFSQLHAIQSIITLIDMNINVSIYLYIYIVSLYLPLYIASKISDILLWVAWAAKFVALVCERIYSCGSIKVWASGGDQTKATHWTLYEYGASKQSIWKIQLYARNSSIRTTFFFYLFSGH